MCKPTFAQSFTNSLKCKGLVKLSLAVPLNVMISFRILLVKAKNDLIKSLKINRKYEKKDLGALSPLLSQCIVF